jgi:arylsulfatase A-like enzyme
MDLFTTSLKLAGAEIPKDRVIDGVDISPLLFGSGPSPRELFFYYRGPQLYAARKGPFKAHFITRPGYGKEPPMMKHDPPLLFQLQRDPSEQFNVAANYPDILADIARAVAEHQSNLVPVKSQLEEMVRDPKP